MCFIACLYFENLFELVTHSADKIFFRKISLRTKVVSKNLLQKSKNQKTARPEVDFYSTTNPYFIQLITLYNCLKITNFSK